MKNRKFKNYLKVGILLFTLSLSLENCENNQEQHLNLYHTDSEQINLKTVSFEDAKSFFKTKNNEGYKDRVKYARKSGESPLELKPNWQTIQHSELFGIDTAELTLADVNINREGNYISKLFFINQNNTIKSVIFTIYQKQVAEDGKILEATMYFNELNGKFLDGYIIEEGTITKRLVVTNPKNIQKAALFLILQKEEVDDCWNTDTLDYFEGGQLGEVIISTSGGSGSSAPYFGNDHSTGGISAATSGNSNHSGGGANYTSITSLAGAIYANNQKTLAEGESVKFDENLLHYEDGLKPIYEYDNKCDGIEKIWSLSKDSGKEFAAVLTDDGAILITQELKPNGGGIGGIYEYNGKTYYQYPTSQGSPSRNYLGQLQSAGRFFIPIKATIHSHTPCLEDGTDGITNRNIDDDQNFAAKYTNINHYIIGCESIGQFNQNSNNAFNIQNGNLNTLCNKIY